MEMIVVVIPLVLIAFAIGWMAGRGTGFEDGYRRCWKDLTEVRR